MIPISRWMLWLLLGLDAAQIEPSTAIKVNVDLVVLQASVRDREGRAPTDLTAQNFTVFEDGARQSIRVFRHEDAPVTVGLVVDHSGSMRAKLADVVVAARSFVRLSRPDNEIFVVNFNEDVTFGLSAPAKFTSRPEELESAIHRTGAKGQTALYDAIVAALRQLRAGSRDKQALIVISDGGDNASTATLDTVLRLAARSNAAIYTIGIFDERDKDRNPAVLRRLARATGGEAFIPNRLGDLDGICRKIADDIRNQYTIGYVSSNKGAPGTFRKIRVLAQGSGSRKLTVRTRSGYVPGGVK